MIRNEAKCKKKFSVSTLQTTRLREIQGNREMQKPDISHTRSLSVYPPLCLALSPCVNFYAIIQFEWVHCHILI